MGLYKQPGSPFWNYRFSLRGTRISGSTKVGDRKLAQKIYEHERSEYILGKKTGATKPIKLRDLLQKFLNDYSRTNKRSYSSDVVAAKRINAFMGDKLASDITPHILEQYKGHRRSMIVGDHQVSGARVNRELAVLKTAYTKGIEWDLVMDNPVRKVKFFSEKDRGRTRYLSHIEKESLLAVCPPELRRVVVVALKTGLRQGELLGLKWVDIDSIANTLAVRRSKNGKMRHVPIHEDVRGILNSLPRIGEYIFQDGSGEPLSRHGRIRTLFDKAVDEAGLRDFRFHDIRRCFASELVMNGADLKTVSELLGHSSTRMTERYSHLTPAHRALAINLLSVETKAPVERPMVPVGTKQGV